jgi:hypothetical protein
MLARHLLRYQIISYTRSIIMDSSTTLPIILRVLPDYQGHLVLGRWVFGIECSGRLAGYFPSEVSSLPTSMWQFRAFREGTNPDW